MKVTHPTDRAMLDGNPEAGTEINSQRATPQCAKFGDQTHLRGVEKISRFCELPSSRPEAYLHVTRHAGHGQRTRDIHQALNRAGAQK